MNRAIWSGTALLGVAVFALCRWLEPDPRGFGTHEQLGLPPCAFRALIGLACPTCGLTTAFAHMARLQIAAAFHAHVLGPVLFLLGALATALALVGAVRTLPVGDTLRRLRASTLAVIIAVAVILVWIVRAVSVTA